MIILKHNGTVYVAKSRFALRETLGRTTATESVSEEDIGIRHPDGRANRLVAVQGRGRFADYIMYEDFFPPVLDEKHLILDTYDKLCDLCTEKDFGNGDELPTSLVLAEGSRAFWLCGDGGRIEIEDIWTNMHEGEAVRALYDTAEVTDPYEFIREAYRFCEDFSGMVMFPVVVADTASNDIKVLWR